jgi:hypothetical protein
MRSCVAAAVRGQALSWSITTSCQKGQSNVMPFHFVFYRKELRHPAWTQFPKTKFIGHNFVKKWQWIFGKVQGKWWNGESSVLLNFFVHCTHQIFINHRRSAASRISMHIIASFIKMSHLSPYHWLTHDMFSIRLTKLTMNVSRFHVSWIQETDYRAHFTCGGLLDFLEHCKHTGQCVNAIWLSANGVRAFQKGQRALRACAS